MLIRYAFASLLVLAACGSDDKTATPDAGTPDGGGSTSTVTKVACPSGTLPSIESTAGNNNSYTPSSVTVAVGGIVQFKMASSHNVVPADRAADAGLKVNFGETACLQFAKAGTFNFKCSPHSFRGSVVVQ